MIKSFKCKETEKLWVSGFSKRVPSDILRSALRKLLQLDGAEMLKDLEAPPNNRLQALHSDRRGQYSIRINNQWRVCFIWDCGHVFDVEIVDYH